MTTKIRKGQAPAKLKRDEFALRFRASFVDPAFRVEDEALARLALRRGQLRAETAPLPRPRPK